MIVTSSKALHWISAGVLRGILLLQRKQVDELIAGNQVQADCRLPKAVSVLFLQNEHLLNLIRVEESQPYRQVAHA